MRLDVDTLAARAELSVDTIRYYQSIGLLHPPERAGRRAYYDETHLGRLERVRTLADRGFSLKAIRAVMEAGGDDSSDRVLLDAIENELESTRYSAGDIAAKLGIPSAVVDSVVKAGLAEPAPDADTGGSLRYTAADLKVAAGAAKLLGYGFPLTRLLRLAIRHDRGVRKTVDEAIDLFDETIRKQHDANEDPEAVAAVFRELMPVVAALVTHHFQRVLVNRALKRLKRSGQRRAFKAALEATAGLRRNKR
jgi:DNA-binding transcriptional MerR regulator